MTLQLKPFDNIRQRRQRFMDKLGFSFVTAILIASG